MDKLSGDQAIVLSKDQLEQVVVEATDAVAAKSSRRERFAIAIIGFAVGALIASGIGIPVTLVLSENAAHKATLAAEANAHNNCRNITRLAEVEEASYREQQIETRRFLDSSKGFHFGLSQRDFSKAIEASELREEVRLASLHAIALTDCRAKVASTPEPQLSTSTTHTKTHPTKAHKTATTPGK